MRHQLDNSSKTLTVKLVFELLTCLTGIYLFKVNNGNTRTVCEISLKLIIKTLERRVHILFWCFRFWLWLSKCRLKIIQMQSLLPVLRNSWSKIFRIIHKKTLPMESFLSKISCKKTSAFSLNTFVLIIKHLIEIHKFLGFWN